MPAKFIPLGDRILVAVIDQEKMLEGVLLPDSSKDDMQVGVVMAVGEGVPCTGPVLPPKTDRIEFLRYAPIILQVGDKIMFGPWAGKDIQIEGIPFRVLRFEEIDGKVVTDERA